MVAEALSEVLDCQFLKCYVLLLGFYAKALNTFVRQWDSDSEGHG
jgi:hypothetical protein